MVKTNSKKSLIAMIAMVVLLIASIAMGITGAWFTDSASVDEDATLDFGKVDISLTESETGAGAWTKLGTADKVMPGSSYAVTYTLKNVGDQDVYYQITATAELQTSTGTKVTGLESYIVVNVNTTSIGSKVVGKEYYELATNDSKTVSFSVSINEETPNKVDTTVLNGGDYKVAISIEVKAVQKANFTANDFAGITTFDTVSAD